MFLLSFAVCTHQHPILISHSPYLTFCLCPSFSTRWMPELKPQEHDLQHSLHRQEKKKVCFYTHKVLPYFSVYLNTQGHGPGCFFLYPLSWSPLLNNSLIVLQLKWRPLESNPCWTSLRQQCQHQLQSSLWRSSHWEDLKLHKFEATETETLQEP